MFRRTTVHSCLLIAFLVSSLIAIDAQASDRSKNDWPRGEQANRNGTNWIKKFATKRYNAKLRKTVRRAKAAKTSAQKRLILSEELRSIIQATERVESTLPLSTEDQAVLSSYRRTVQEMHDRLNGLNGFAPVPATQLNDFSDNIQQSLELGDTLTILAYVGLFVLGILLATLLALSPLLL
jgi:hypothetical protein